MTKIIQSRPRRKSQAILRWQRRYPEVIDVRFVGTSARATAICPYCDAPHEVWLAELNRRSRSWSKYTCQKCAEILKGQPGLVSGDQTLRHLVLRHRRSAENLNTDVQTIISFLFLRINQRKSQYKRGKSRHESLISVFDLPIIPKFCPVFPWVCLQLSENSDGSKNRGWAADSTISLDRTDASQGYVPGNIMWMSMRANMIKRDATLDELEALGVYASKWRGLDVV
jgi:hypothetical protein